MKDANHSYNLTLLILQNEKRLTFWLVLSCDLLERRRIDDVTINNVLTLYCIKKTDSMLPWVCTVKYHIRRKNVVGSSVTHPAAPLGSLFCSHRI